MPRDNLSDLERRELLAVLSRLAKATADAETRRRTLWLVGWIEGRDPFEAMRLAGGEA